jgi:predicted nucleotidyltransferase component of viral defense system
MQADSSGFKNLLPDTERVLNQLAALAILKDFTFVGGSALAVYLGHRKSEDIDLFTWHKELDAMHIYNAINAFGFQQVDIIDLSPIQADFVIEGVKVTFFANGWEALRNRQQIMEHLYIAELELLAVMKINTLFLRAKFRDYYDIYILYKNVFTLEKMFELTNVQMRNLSRTLFQRALVYTEDLADEDLSHLELKEPVTAKQISQHFIKAIQSWNSRQP